MSTVVTAVTCRGLSVYVLCANRTYVLYIALATPGLMSNVARYEQKDLLQCSRIRLS